MERIYLNQTALSLGYIALKRIRALEAPATRLPSNPLLRHLGHVKILAACVEQVGPDEIIEYEMNQDFAASEPSNESFLYEEETGLDRSISGRKETDIDTSERRYPIFAPSTSKSKELLPCIKEYTEDQENRICLGDDEPRKPLSIKNLTPGDLEDDGDFSMDELYDEYNSLEDDWETASELSDDGKSFENMQSTSPYQTSSPRAFKDVDTDSDEEEDIPTPPNNVVISRSPPLDITMRHPITHELSKREQYRRQMDTTGNDLSRAFVEQIEDVWCHEMRCFSMRGVAEKTRLETFSHRSVSLCA